MSPTGGLPASQPAQFINGPLKRGTKVSWQVKGPLVDCPRGNGVVITDEVDGEVLVKVNSLCGEPNPGYHQVICCTVTWLTVEA